MGWIVRRGSGAWADHAFLGDGGQQATITGEELAGGQPAMALPAGELGGLPLGLQCVARYGDDERLVQWATGIADAIGAAV